LRVFAKNFVRLHEVLFDNQFIMSSDLENIRRYEQMLHLQASSKDTLADRRFKVLSKWNRIIHYTKVTLRQRLAVLCGEDGYTLDTNPDKKVIVKVALKSKRNLKQVKRMLEEFIPCNMVIDLNLLYNQHYLLSGFTHKQLGAWGTIGSGYYRHGNLTGKANVIIQLNIYVTVKLTANIAYLISGFPFRENSFDVELSTHIPDRTSLCYLRNTGSGYSEIYFMP
jgi:hypothetical protein